MVAAPAPQEEMKEFIKGPKNHRPGKIRGTDGTPTEDQGEKGQKGRLLRSFQKRYK